MHARDVVEKLVAAAVSRKGDFEWVSQLRFYWEESPSYLGDTNLLVRMVQVTGCHCHCRYCLLHCHLRLTHLHHLPLQVTAVVRRDPSVGLGMELNAYNQILTVRAAQFCAIL